MHTKMDWWTKIRPEVSREEDVRREILRLEGIGWKMLKRPPLISASKHEALGVFGKIPISLGRR